MLCERGIRTYEEYVRNTLALAAVPELHRVSHLPVVIDPSQGTGKSYLVDSMCRAAVAAGADGLIIEVHNDPEHALTDGAQSITPPAVRRDDEVDPADRGGGGSGSVAWLTHSWVGANDVRASILAPIPEGMGHAKSAEGIGGLGAVELDADHPVALLEDVAGLRRAWPCAESPFVLVS